MNTSRRNARGAASLRTILEKTASLVGRYGYDGTTIARITRVAGKPASSIYWYFETKDELIAAALESTYRRGPGEARGWGDFIENTSLEGQLRVTFEDEFTPAATEEPVRLGIMVALEGSAAQSPAQKPFLRRRQWTEQQISQWWSGAVSSRMASDRADIAEWMTLLTLAFLDGHYISDAAPRTGTGTAPASIVAGALTSALDHLATREDPLAPPRPPAAGGLDSPMDQEGRQPNPESDQRILDGALPTRDVLLSRTRSLVAERGYEAATMSEICQRAQMQRSSIYWRYKSKDELIHAAVAEPFLTLIACATPAPADAAAVAAGPADATCPQAWQTELAESLQRGVAAAMADPDCLKAGLLLKLQRRDPPTRGSRAIQAGLTLQRENLTAWISAVASAAGSSLDAEALGWMVEVLTEGLLLSVAFGQEFPTPALAQLATAMIQGAAAAASLDAPTSTA